MESSRYTIGKALPAEVEAAVEAYNAACRYASRDLASLEDGDEAERLGKILRDLYDRYGVEENDRVVGV